MSQNTKPQGKFVQEFGLGAAIILFVSSILGSGVYKKVAPMASDLQSPSLVLWAWAAAGLITLFGVLTTAEIGGVITESGGPYAYFRRIYGRRFAFYYGWSSFSAIQSASIASIAYVFAQAVNALLPLPALGGAWETFTILGIFMPFANLGVKLTAVALILLLAIVNYRGVKEGGWVSKVITVLVVVSLFFIIITGLSISSGSVDHLRQAASTYPPESFSGNLGFIGPFFAAMLGAFWAYEGWLNIGFIGEEVKNPQRNIPMALIFGILIIITIYLLVNAAYLYVIPVDEMITIARSENAIAAVEVIRAYLGQPGVLFISLLIIITTVGCTNATILTAARVYYSMARNGLFTGRAHYLHPKFNTPSRVLIMQAIWSGLLVFSGTFDQLTEMLIFASFIFYGAIAAGIFVLRRKEPSVYRPYKAFGYPIVPLIFVVFCAVLVLITCFQRPREAGMGLFLILIGTPFYWYWNRKYGTSKE
ncbi:MAG TPA: amino acid permease [Saprospiraceae bacterium]|nr:amino acid permease [Saprospiraceae bacterium]